MRDEANPIKGRRFIRHPVTIPIEASCAGQEVQEQSLCAYCIGMGGLAFRGNIRLEPGTVVFLRIPCVEPEFETNARVVWCTESGKDMELGVEFFNSDDAFKARMVEQVCHIENYRQNVRRSEGRQLTPDEAAVEWVTKFAANFPDPGSEAVRDTLN